MNTWFQLLAHGVLLLYCHSVQAFQNMNFVQKKRSGLSNERLDFFQTCCNAKNVNISENGDQIDEEVLNEIFGFSRREFVNWGAAGASLCSLFDPSSASAKPAKDPTEQESYNPTIPYSSVRQYKSIKFSNGMQVLLVSDKNARQATAALTIGGAGQFSDPTDLNGLAHLMEHMVLSSPNSRRRIASKSQDFEDWLSDYDGASNGFTAYEKVCFHFNCLTEIFPDALERFARLFLQEVIQKNCRNEETLKREVRRVNSELDSSNGFFRELYLIKSLINPEHPYARLSKGSLESLETIPAKLGLDVGQSLIKFFKERYQPSKAILVVVSRSDLTSLETWVAPFASTLSRERVEEEPQRVFPEFFPNQNRISTICLFRQKSSTVVGEDLEKLSFQWALNLDYSGAKQSGRSIVTATQIGFVLSQIFGRRGPGSLYTLLRKRGWIPEGSQGLPRIIFPVDVPGFQLMKLEISLTLEGFSSRSSVIAAVYDSINSLQFSSIPTAPFRLKRELIAEYATVAQLYGYVLSPRPPDAVELAFDGQLYGVDVPRATGNPEWLRFPSPKDSIGVLRIQKCLQDTLVFMSDPANAIIIATASNKAIQFAKQNVLDNSLPPMSPASWDISPVSGARYYFDNMFRLSGKVNEWLVARLLEDELSPPVLNPLIPPMLSPARILDSRGFTEESSPLLLNSDVEREGSRLKRLMQRSRRDVEDDGSDPETYDDPTKSSLVRDYWAVLQVLSHEKSALSLRLPRAPPEPSGRCVFVLQLISSRPARAKVKSAAHAELWKMSLEYAVSDLAELGAPAGLAYEISFNKFGMRICFLGLSQNIASYARRLSRRIVEHQSRLLEGPENLPASVVEAAVRSANLASNLSSQRRRRILTLLRESSAAEAAVEGIAFFKSCSGGVCISQGDLLPKETINLLGDLKGIFRTVTGTNVKQSPALPEVEDIIYPARWIPRSASSCTIAGASLVSDACGRVPR